MNLAMIPAATDSPTADTAIGSRLGTRLARGLAWLAAFSRPSVRTATLDLTKIERIDNPRGRSITCLSGALWLTFDGEPQDAVLEAGQSLRCEHDVPLLISAFGHAVWRAD
jgi:Protein of unknown function (DUF2917)